MARKHVAYTVNRGRVARIRTVRRRSSSWSGALTGFLRHLTGRARRVKRRR